MKLIESDIALIGSGVMSANLGAMLKRLQPSARIQLYEVTEKFAQESSHGWNNAGTGHAGLCELSYTPNREADGSVNVSKAIQIFEQFERSRQFWSYGVANGMLGTPSSFINPVAHISFVHGADQVDYLRARYEGLKQHHFFSDMTYSVDRAEIARWAPLLVGQRDPAQPIAATKVDHGTDVNFGELSRQLLAWLGQQEGCSVLGGHRVVDLTETSSGWELKAKNLATGEIVHHRTKFVFVGAGGGSILLLQKAGIPEAKGLGGFPIGGQWLVCTKPEIVRQHEAKVYGQPLETAPTMAVPHLDTRILDGQKTLLFGPFAAWTTKFLHQRGSSLDLFNSVKADNLATLLNVGVHNLGLVRYLIQQGTQSMADRIAVLRLFYPAARAEDWKLTDGGIRVQAIKKTDGQAGIVHYGTEVITNAAKNLSALLGASPGASVSVDIALDLVKRCFPHWLATPEGKARMDAMIPMWDGDMKLPAAAAQYRALSAKADGLLNLAPRG